MTPDGDVVYAAAPVAPTANNYVSNYGGHPGIAPIHYLPQGSFPNYSAGYSTVPQFSQGPRGGQFDVPGLHRRGSHSTIEGSVPGTPSFYAGTAARPDANIATLDRSPLYATPSPPGLSQALLGKAMQFGSPRTANDLYIDKLLVQHPAIPRAIPAVYTPRENLRTLEQSLSNPIAGNRNVYIRGLHPDTHDDTLAAYAIRFGKVETTKAIIDNSTGACKGYVYWVHLMSGQD